MTSSGIRGSNLWTWTHIAVIIACAVLVLYPPALHLQAFMLPFGFVLMPLCFYLHIRSIKEDKLAGLSLGELYTQAKGGRRFPKSGLATAAAIALLLATVFSASGAAGF